MRKVVAALVVGGGLLWVGVNSPADAALLCKKKSGVAVVRDACKRKEIPVDVAGLIGEGAIGGAKLANGAITPAKVGAIPAARVFNSTTISQGLSNTTLTFDSERFDIGGLHDTSANTSRLTAPVDGVYAISGNVAFTGTCSQCFLGVLKNGSTFIGDHTGTSTVSNDFSVGTIAKLAAGEYVELIMFSDAPGVRSSDEYSPEFTMVWIAPGS